MLVRDALHRRPTNSERFASGKPRLDGATRGQGQRHRHGRGVDTPGLHLLLRAPGRRSSSTLGPCADSYALRRAACRPTPTLTRAASTCPPTKVKGDRRRHHLPRQPVGRILALGGQVPRNIVRQRCGAPGADVFRVYEMSSGTLDLSRRGDPRGHRLPALPAAPGAGRRGDRRAHGH